MTTHFVLTREAISALVDGQLREEEFAQTVEAMHGDEQARATWRAYHVVGDVLRSGQDVAGQNDAAFLARLHQKLQNEVIDINTVNQPNAINLIAKNSIPETVSSTFYIKNESANSSWFDWHWVAGVATLATAVGVGLGWMSGNDLSKPTREVASVQTAPVMIRDPQLDALLAAHQQFGGTSALQMPAGFLRNATYEGDK